MSTPNVMQSPAVTHSRGTCRAYASGCNGTRRSDALEGAPAPEGVDEGAVIGPPATAPAAGSALRAARAAASPRIRAAPNEPAFALDARELRERHHRQRDLVVGIARAARLEAGVEAPRCAALRVAASAAARSRAPVATAARRAGFDPPAPTTPSVASASARASSLRPSSTRHSAMRPSTSRESASRPDSEYSTRAASKCAWASSNRPVRAATRPEKPARERNAAPVAGRAPDRATSRAGSVRRRRSDLGRPALRRCCPVPIAASTSLPGPQSRVAAALVELDGLVPPALVVREAAEILEHARLAGDVAELRVDLERGGRNASRARTGRSTPTPSRGCTARALRPLGSPTPRRELDRAFAPLDRLAVATLGLAHRGVPA